MRQKRHPVFEALTAAAAAIFLFTALAALSPQSTIRYWREMATDTILAYDPPDGQQLVVVDIDSASLKANGPWPWPRARLNDLLASIAAGRPRVVLLDILLTEVDRLSPKALARGLEIEKTPQLLRSMLLDLPDSDEELARPLASFPTVLAMLFGREPASPPQQAPVLMAGASPRLSPWRAEGVLVPLPVFSAAAAGLGVASLEQETGGRVRRVPLFGLAGDTVVAGLAAETLRIAEDAGSFILRADDGHIDIGGHRLPFDTDLTLRIRPSGPNQWASRTVSADDVLSAAVGPARFNDKIVLVGSGAPELGALRTTAASVIAPSVQIQADALATALSGKVPFRPPHAFEVEIGAFIALATAGAVSGALLGRLVM